MPAQTPHPAIEIHGDSDFASQASIEGWSGNGSETSPYVIQGLNITSTDYVECIHIESVSVFFEITDCWMTSIREYSSCVYLVEVSNALVEFCTISSRADGLMLGRVHDSVFQNNDVYSGRTAVLLWETMNCSFVNNAFNNGGVSFWPMDETELQNEFLNNTVREGKLGYFLNVTDSTIDAALMGQVILGSCSNVVVKNGRSSYIDCGLSVFFSENCTVEGFEIAYTNRGVHVMYSDGTRVLENEISNTRFTSILVNSSDDCVIRRNAIYGGGANGIELSDSANVSIIDNEIRGHSTGVNIYWADCGIVASNFVTKCYEYGVHLHYDTRNYTLFNNTFGFNLQSNGRDDGVGNVWDDGVSIGNAWDDYAGSGIYVIPGEAGSVDRFPRLPNETSIDYTPGISHPEDIAYLYESTGNAVTWTLVARRPASYSVFKDGFVVLSATWDGYPVTIGIDHLEPGFYNFTLYVEDIEGNSSSSDAVMVYVYTITYTTLPTNSTTSTSSTTLTNTTTSTTTAGLEKLVGQIVTIGSVCVIVVLVVLIIRTKPEGASMGWGR